MEKKPKKKRAKLPRKALFWRDSIKAWDFNVKQLLYKNWFNGQFTGKTINYR